MKKIRIIAFAFAAAILSLTIKIDIYADEGKHVLSYHGELDEPAEAVDENNSTNRRIRDGEIPAAYKTENLPDIRNQNPYGTCWAFSATSLAEISLLKKEDKLLDLSELQHAYFVNNTVTDPLGGTYGDRNYLLGADDFLDAGGDLVLSMQAYSTWAGVSLESDVSYKSADLVRKNGLSNKYAYSKDVAHIKNAYKINIKKNPNEAKRMLLQNGALGVSYCERSADYNKTYNSYNGQISNAQNHAVTIVGWDDEFPKNHFNVSAKEDGAWLIRNSWGEEKESHSGYFWLSYYDKSLSDNAYAFEFVSDKKSKDDGFYDNNYQYDGAAYSWAINQKKAANIFETKHDNEKLKAVCFGVSSTDCDYIVSVYKNLASVSDPESGVCVSKQSGKTTFEGMYTIPLKDEVNLKKGDVYSVVVELNNSKAGSYYFYVEHSYVSDWFNCETSAKNGESFIFSGSSWIDYGNYFNANVRIKAFTDDVDEEVEGYEPNASLSLDQSELEFDINQTSYTITPSLKMENSKNNVNYYIDVMPTNEIKNAGYSVSKNKDGKFTVKVDTSKIRPTEKHYLKFVAKASDDSDLDEEKYVLLKTRNTSLADLIKNNTGEYRISLSNEKKAKVIISSTVTGKVLSENQDYTIKYEYNEDNNSTTAKIRGCNWYSGEIWYTYSNSLKSNYLITDISALNLRYGQKGVKIYANAGSGKDSISFISKDDNVVKVDKAGNVTIVGCGKTQIKVIAEAPRYNKETFNIPVTVVKQEKKISVGKKEITKVFGDKAFILEAKTNVNENLSYVSSNKKIAVVDKNGKVTLKAPGRVTITITSPESAKYKAASAVKVDITVKPRKIKLSSVTNVKGKKAKISWKKDTTVSGYEVVYSLDNFKKSKTVTIKSNKTISTIAKKLTLKKKCSVKVRAYKTVNGKKIYGDYSTVKIAVIKK